jgi:hypothetical protein
VRDLWVILQGSLFVKPDSNVVFFSIPEPDESGNYNYSEEDKDKCIENFETTGYSGGGSAV